ncbi:ExbD/TolR family protein [Myxacorys almedinensis]|uniref:Biopolymer transporter ExbD n=1 Tax=Myxacorys almedinensis A TaxID=2690445 RepID=A0A8J7Z3W9_9CYAN|nr:biopolymer transporter ExbD [Myxacorys almedinensis]NDJ19962.1 biopolymer transporter ExbD [Myxacorys almedinensis A]
MRLPEEPDLPPQIYIVPMIDVVFAILTFFILSTLYLTRSQGLRVSLPSAATAQSQNASQVVVSLDQKGNLALDKQPIKLNVLSDRVRTLLSRDRQAVVIINADERVSHGQVVAVMDQLRTIPNIRLGIATQQP